MPEYDQDTGDVVGTRSRAKAIATNPLTILGIGAAAIVAGEVLVPAAATGAATNAGVAGAAVDAAASAAPAAEEAQTLTPFAQRYLSTSGGRLGSTSTRQQLYDIATGYAKSSNYPKLEGDGYGPEEFLQDSLGGSKTFVDLTATAVDGTVVRIQTIDTLADGMTPTMREAAAAARIRMLRPNDKLMLIPKR